MELKVNEVLLPEEIRFNYEELKNELSEQVRTFETLVYTDDQIKEAKADRARLNKLKKALNDERIRREKLYMKPFIDFKAKINELTGIIDKAVCSIDKQVKEYENKKREEKAKEISGYWQGVEKPEWMKDSDLSKIFNNDWLNASYSMARIKDDIKNILAGIAQDLDTLANLQDIAFEATEVYKNTLNVSYAIKTATEHAEMEKRKAEAMRQGQLETADKKIAAQTETPEDPAVKNPDKSPKQSIKLEIFLNYEQAQKLRLFFNENNIEFRVLQY